ncbi:hypothetical protein AVEN_223444-1 [Araneus ventricosus]|uniref:Reverse transcriptase domain-containing protein n=1 Tax=Araneus ventricosus TaxID=182803 RepID=A0A4Y2ET90_ARAVE|nr:hypothetical protein AVEN_223444-1 [Araneus ventricosus]
MLEMVYKYRFTLVILTSRFEATRGLFWDGPRNFEPRSDEEGDARAGIPSPSFHATPTGGRLATTGPALWNLVADEALSLQYPPSTSIQAFADDFLIVAAAGSERALGSLASEALATFKTWSDKHKLEIAVEKTNFLLLSNLRRGPSIFWDGRRLKRVRVSKYLGVFFDQKLNWAHHLKEQGAKALQQHRSLMRIAGTTWGLTQKLRLQLYKTVTERTLAHGDAIWGRDITWRLQTYLEQKPKALSPQYYRSLQDNTGLMPLHIKMQTKAQLIQISRLRQDILIGNRIYRSVELEEKASGWPRHPSLVLGEERVCPVDSLWAPRSKIITQRAPRWTQEWAQHTVPLTTIAISYQCGKRD